MLSRLLWGLVHLSAARAAGERGDVAIGLFCDDVVKSGRSRSFVFEVGANDGTWSDSVMERCRRKSPESNVRLVVVEPQAAFHARLGQLARKWGGRLIPHAAWTSETNLTFYLSNFQEASSLSETMALTFNDPEVRPTVRRTTVRSVDLAAVMLRALGGPRAGASILKLDVESAEYDLIPKMVASGVLCRLQYVVVEWHLNALAPERRLTGLMLRHGVDDLLRRGCARPPKLVVHDDDVGNNEGEPVLGLDALAQRHRAALRMPGKRMFSYASSIVGGSSPPSTRLSRFLHSSVDGVCDGPSPLVSDEEACEGGKDRGHWKTAPGADRTWTTLAQECLGKCRTCARCRFVSLDVRSRSCFWFESCDLSRLVARRGVVTGRARPSLGGPS